MQCQSRERYFLEKEVCQDLRLLPQMGYAMGRAPEGTMSKHPNRTQEDVAKAVGCTPGESPRQAEHLCEGCKRSRDPVQVSLPTSRSISAYLGDDNMGSNLMADDLDEYHQDSALSKFAILAY